MKKNSGQKSRATVPLREQSNELFWLSFSSIIRLLDLVLIEKHASDFKFCALVVELVKL